MAAEEALVANPINRAAPKDQVPKQPVLEAALSRGAAANPPLPIPRLVCATSGTRRWLLDRYAKPAAFQRALMRLRLTDDVHEAALAFKETRKPRGFNGT